MRLSTLTYLGFETNAALEACPSLELPLAEIHVAAQRERLVALLAERLGDKVDLSLLTHGSDELPEVEAALRDAAAALHGREARKVGVRANGLHFVIALIFEAIQQRFCPLAN